LRTSLTFVNPEMIALGGGVAGAGDFLLDAVRPKVEELTTVSPRGQTKIVIATLGNDAGSIGAGTMARRGGLTASETELQLA
jgi:glucokinase